VNVFMIPSWYPGERGPWAPAFQRDQALAVAALRHDWNVAVSVWGQTSQHLVARHPFSSLRTALTRSRDRASGRNALDGNVVEYVEPTLTWTHRVLKGNRRGLLQANIRAFQRALQELGTIDVIHAHVAFPGGLAAMDLAGTVGVPYVVTEYMSPFPFPMYLQGDGRAKQIVRDPLVRAAGVVAISPQLAVDVRKLGVLRVDVVAPPTDETFFTPQPAKARHETVFFTLGRLEEQKGIVTLLGAVARLAAHDKGQLRYRIGGDGSRRDEYQRLARRLGVADRVEWLGPLSRERVRDELQQCDAFVLASRHESLGIVFAEAMACGKPVVATRCGGPEWFVTADVGLLTPVGDEDALADALIDMARTHDDYDGIVIRERFLERFSRPVVVDQLEAVYRRVTAGPDRGLRTAASAG